MIKRADRATFYGHTGTGKSELARRFFVGFASPRGVIDVKDDLEDKLPGVTTIGSPSELTQWQTWRAVPPERDSEDWYSEIYRAALAQGDTLVWIDEANEVTSPNKIPDAMRRFVLQGRSRNCGHLACTPRPADINPTIAAQSQHLYVFDVPHPLDRQAIARLTGRDVAEIGRLLDELPPFGFLHYEVATRTLSSRRPSHDPDELTEQIEQLDLSAPMSDLVDITR